MTTWDSKCKRCGLTVHVPVGKKPSTSCPKCVLPTEAKILHTGVNRATRRRMEHAQRKAAKQYKYPVVAGIAGDGHDLDGRPYGHPDYGS